MTDYDEDFAASHRQKIFHPTTINELTNMVATISSRKKPASQGRSHFFQRDRTGAPNERYLLELESEIADLKHVTEAQQTQITDLESESVGLRNIILALIDFCAGLEQRILKDENDIKKRHDSILTSVSGPVVFKDTPIRDDEACQTENAITTPVNRHSTSGTLEVKRAERKRNLENVISPNRGLPPSTAQPNFYQDHSDRHERPLREQKTKHPSEIMAPKSKRCVQKVSFIREHTYSVTTSMSSIDESLKRKPQRQIMHQKNSNHEGVSEDDEDTWSNGYNDDGGINDTGFENRTPSRSRNRNTNEGGSHQCRRNRNPSRNCRRSVSITRVTEVEEFSDQ